MGHGMMELLIARKWTRSNNELLDITVGSQETVLLSVLKVIPDGPLALILRDLYTLRFYNQICKMENNHLTKQVYLFDKQMLARGSWCQNARNLCESIGCLGNWERNEIVNIKEAKCKLLIMNKLAWTEGVKKKRKLTYFSNLNGNMEASPHLGCFLSKAKRSLISQIPLGCLPLEVETARFTNTVRHERICKICNSNQVEDELHFLFNCSGTHRTHLELYNQMPELLHVSDLKLRFKLLNGKPYVFGNYLFKLWNHRNELL